MQTGPVISSVGLVRSILMAERDDLYPIEGHRIVMEKGLDKQVTHIFADLSHILGWPVSVQYERKRVSRQGADHEGTYSSEISTHPARWTTRVEEVSQRHPCGADGALRNGCLQS